MIRSTSVPGANLCSRLLQALCGWSLLLGGCGVIAADGAAGAAITEIRLERDCFGCAQGSLLLLRHDGSAHHTRTGKARHGTEDLHFAGAVDPADFAALARLLEQEGFPGMDALYEDPELRDGAWVITAITRGETTQQVLRRGDAGPAALQRIEAAIGTLASRIHFAPLPR